MGGERNLETLLAELTPELNPRRFVFTSVQRVPEGLEPVALVRESEGITLVVDQGDADHLGLFYEYVAAMITLRVHSALDAVGLTAAVAHELARADMSCNVIAAYHHDHLFVPVDRGDEAVALLRAL